MDCSIGFLLPANFFFLPVSFIPPIFFFLPVSFFPSPKGANFQ